MLDLPPQSIKQLLVVMPSWVGDVVMATPTLRTLRQRFAGAHITASVRPNVASVLDGCPWVDDIVPQPHRSAVITGRALRKHIGKRIDLAMILPNSFRTAVLGFASGAKDRVGYSRDGRGWLLTHGLRPRRASGKFTPYPVLRYYLEMAEAVGCHVSDRTMALFTRREDDARAKQMIGSHDGPVVLLNPGAKYGAAKMWPPDRFAAVADALIEQIHARVLVNGSPNERQVLDEVHAAAKHALIDLPGLGSDLRLLKSIVKLVDLMITNDTGPRHFAAALGTPVITIFGPTHRQWSEIDFADETQIQLDVECGPCQLKLCPLDHRCMTGIGADMITDHAMKELNRSTGGG